ncbi:hypothetical protein BH09PSE5_BH09PSE5_39670 [soil metagenome]
MDRGRDRPTPARFRQLSLFGITIVALFFAAWMWIAGSPASRLNAVGGEAANPSSAYAVEACLGVFALLALLAAGLAMRSTATSLRREASLVEELHASREQAQALTKVLDVWQWTTDPQHRLTNLRPPDGADPSMWATLPTTVDGGNGTAASGDSAMPVLWEHFNAGVTGNRSLRARLDARAPLDQLTTRTVLASRDAGLRRGGFTLDLPADQPTETVVRSAWRLRAAPRFDGQGRFCGYTGTAREVDGNAQILSDMLQASPLPMVAASAGRPDDSPARVQWSNAAADQLFDAAPGELKGMPWLALLGRLPSDRCPDLAQVLGAALDDTAVAPPPAPSLRSHRWHAKVQRLPADGGRAAASNGQAAGGSSNGLMLVLVPSEPENESESMNPGDSISSIADSEAFSYTVSHDLRAPIRVVEGFTKILKEDYGRQLDRVGNDHLDRVLGAAARMNSMIDALLSLAQLSATPLVRQPINLSQLAQYIVDDLRRQSPEREVAVHIEAGMQVRGDPTLMRIALENLLGNAWKYTAKRRLAQLWFETETMDQGPAFTVRDNGAGFDMRFADRLFGVFQRLHSANDFQGTGVGLASVRRIIRRHGGEIWADSEPERGARFHFTLPQRQDR